MRSGSAHNGLTQYAGQSTGGGACGVTSPWLSEGLVTSVIPEVYAGWNDPQGSM